MESTSPQNLPFTPQISVHIGGIPGPTRITMQGGSNNMTPQQIGQLARACREGGELAAKRLRDLVERGLPDHLKTSALAEFDAGEAEPLVMQLNEGKHATRYIAGDDGAEGRVS